MPIATHQHTKCYIPGAMLVLRMTTRGQKRGGGWWWGWSNFWKSAVKSESESLSVMSDSLRPQGLYSPWNSPGQNTGVGSLSLLQGSFLTQGSNPGLLHCRWILYQLSHKGSPRILEWVTYPFSSRSSPTQELNRGLLHCRWSLSQMSCQGKPPILHPKSRSYTGF